MFQIKLCTADRLPCFGCQICITCLITLGRSQCKKSTITLAMIVVNFFHSEWASVRGINGDIGQKTKAELDANLRCFYAEARNKDGGNYSRSTLLEFRNGLERYLNNPPYKKGIHIATDPAFQQSNQMLDAKLKDMKKQGNKMSSTNLPLSVRTCGV